MAPRIIGNRYELIARVGRGGMAAVYRGTDQRLLRDVAIKLLSPGGDSEESLFYFHREARAIAALRHQNIVQIYDYSGPEESPAYIVMELIEGGNIDQKLMVHHPLPEDIIVSAAYSVASALQHAHEHGVIHRDIKPANVMVENSGRLLLTDFGIAKAYADAAQLGKTFSGKATQLFGTPDFMAPEQILEEQLGPHTDVFALGSLIYCMGTNVSPFDHQDPVEILRRVVDVEFTPLPQLRPELSPKLNAIVELCLQADTQSRPSSAKVAEYCEDLLFDNRVSNGQRNIHLFLRGERTADNKPLRPARELIADTHQESENAATAPPAAYEAEETAPDQTGDTQVYRGDLHGKPFAPHSGDLSRQGLSDVETGGLQYAEGDTDKLPEQNDTDKLPEQNDNPSPPPARGTIARLKGLVASLPFELRSTPVVAVSSTLSVVLILLVVYALTPRESQRDEAAVEAIGAGGSEAVAHDTAKEGEVGAGGSRDAGAGGNVGRHEIENRSARFDDTPPEINYGTLAETNAETAIDTSEHDSDSPLGEETDGSQANAVDRPPDDPSEVRPRNGPKPRPKGKKKRGKKGLTGKKGKAFITVTVKPWGTVYLNGQKRGNTPAVRLLEVKPGKHTVSVSHPAFGNLKKIATLKAGDKIPMAFDFRKK